MRAHWNPCVSPPCFHPFRECLAEQTFRDEAGGTNRDGPLPYTIACDMAKRGPKQCPCLYRPNPAPQQKALLPIRMKPKHPMRVGKAKLKSAFIHARPHVRGEDPAPVRGFPAPSETPPRTWGRPVRAAMRRDTTGNTPTHVGKTHTRMRSKKLMEKHPHARGEDPEAPKNGRQMLETPPRTWGRLNHLHNQRSTFGNTPTHVGKTLNRSYLYG